MKVEALGLLTLGLLAAPHTGQAVIIGVDNSLNCIPFACDNSLDYRQVYAAGEFAGPISIGSLSFFPDDRLPTVSLSSGVTWAMLLSTTVSAVATGPLVDGADILQVYLGGGPALAGGKFRFELSNVFFYDPARGNLLLTVIRSTGGSREGFLAAEGRVSDCRMSRTILGNQRFESCLGLVTEFATAPEPGSLALLGLGLAGLGLSRRLKGNWSLRTTQQGAPAWSGLVALGRCDLRHRPHRRRHADPALCSALNLNVHLHMILVDGVYVTDGAD